MLIIKIWEEKKCKAKINTMYRSLFGKKEGTRKTFISICTIPLLLNTHIYHYSKWLELNLIYQ